MRISNTNTDLSPLFATSKTDSIFDSIDLGTYDSIKNGSYNKLLKNYYAEKKKIESEQVDKTSKEDKKTDTTKKTDTSKDTDKTGLSTLKKDADTLKKSVDKLASDDLWKQTAGVTDKDKIVSAVKDFAENYNDVLSQASKVNNKDVSLDVGYMKDMTKTFSKVLDKVGINVGTDGKLSVDEDKLKNADDATLKNLFNGATTYGAQIADKANNISNDVIRNNSLYGNGGLITDSVAGLFDKGI